MDVINRTETHDKCTKNARVCLDQDSPRLVQDCISRQDAIDFIDAGHLANPNEPRWSDNEVVNFLKSRPSVQAEDSDYKQGIIEGRVQMRTEMLSILKEVVGDEVWKNI